MPSCVDRVRPEQQVQRTQRAHVIRRGLPMSVLRAQRDDAEFAASAHSASFGLALLLLPVLGLSLALGSLRPLAFAGPTGLAFLLLRLRKLSAATSHLPNLITALRVALTGLLGLDLLGSDPVPYAIVVLLVFTLDGVDGTLAVLCEVLESFDGFEAEATNDRQGGIS